MQLIDQLKARGFSVGANGAVTRSTDPSTLAPVVFCYNFTRSLSVDLPINDSELKALSRILFIEGISTQEPTLAFDEVTASRVVKLQAKYGILQTGFVGPITRAKLNSLYGCGNQSNVSIYSINPTILDTNGSSGPLTLNGAGFKQSTKVYLGQADLSRFITSVSSDGTRLSFTMIEGEISLGDHRVKVSNDGGVSFSNEVTLKIVSTASNNPVMCTADAMQCPDGSYVGRSGPSCQFRACPGSVVSTQPSITIESPAENERWSIGSKHVIRVRTAGINSAYGWSIYFFLNGGQIGGFRLGQDHNYEVTIPSTVVVGGDMVTTLNPGVYNLEAVVYDTYPACVGYCAITQSKVLARDSSKKVTIVEKPALPKAPVINGVSGPRSLSVGEQAKWTVNAYDINGEALLYSVVWGDEAYTLDNAKEAPWVNTSTFTHTYERAGVFTPRFYVRNADSSEVTSLNINVGNVSSTPSVTVLYPNGGEVWQTGKTYEFKWNFQGLEKVIINLSKGDIGYGTLDPVTASLGKVSYLLPLSLPVGQYKVFIADGTGRTIASDYSDNYFTITASSTYTTF